MVGDLFHTPVEITRPEMLLHIDAELVAEPVAAASKRKKWLEVLKGKQMTMFAPHLPDMAPVQF